MAKLSKIFPHSQSEKWTRVTTDICLFWIGELYTKYRNSQSKSAASAIRRIRAKELCFLAVVIEGQLSLTRYIPSFRARLMIPRTVGTGTSPLICEWQTNSHSSTRQSSQKQRNLPRNKVRRTGRSDFQRYPPPTSAPASVHAPSPPARPHR